MVGVADRCDEEQELVVLDWEKIWVVMAKEKEERISGDKDELS